MTTQVLNYSQSLLNGTLSFFKKTLQGIMIGYMVARQTEANKSVAEAMVATGDWAREDYYVILRDLNAKTIDSIHKEVVGKND